MEALRPYTDTFGIIAMICAIAMALIGLPLQVHKNRKDKEGQPFVLITLAIGVYFFRALYGLSISSWYILVPDVLGVVFSVILLRQWYVYVHKTKKPPR